MRLLFFAKSRELSGTSDTELLVSSDSELTGKKLLDIIVSNYPRFGSMLTLGACLYIVYRERIGYVNPVMRIDSYVCAWISTGV